MPANFSQEIAKELSENAQKIACAGKGILAADESTGTIKKRFDNINVENSEANRAAYRKLLFTTKDLGNHISGAILYEETLFQSADGVKMVDMLKAQNIIPGIKVDMGVVVLPGTDGETATQGLDGLAARCKKYYEAGARFAKWRAVVRIDEAKCQPTPLAITETAHTLARYAAICQENRLVPIVEPEILQDGAHSIEHCAKVSETVFAACFAALMQHNVLLEGALLKPNMITPGADATKRATAEEIAFYTVRTLRRTVPPALVGIMFLSGGQSEEEASLNLNAMNKLPIAHPWRVSFSYGRALQQSCLQAWQGKTENIPAAQKVLFDRAQANGHAQLGKYAGGVASTGSLFEKGYVY